LVDKVWPLIKEKLPNSRLRIVGSAPTKKILRYAEKDSQVIVTGRVPDIRDEYAKAHVLVAPVFSGKGTRYKVLEAMATETPVVGTGIALEGIGAQTDIDFLEGNTAEELANQTVRVLKDEKLQEKLGKSGRSFVMKNFSWDHIAAKLLDIYEQTSR
jgi:glycosyltransferase involved in cell wall biosynthesis